jgi:signal transduction histidine kinase
MNQFSHPFPVLSLIAAFTLLSLGIFGLKQKRVSGAHLFYVLMFIGAGVAFLFYFEVTLQQVARKVLALKFEYFGVATITVVWMLLAAHYSGVHSLLRPPNVAILFIIPAITILLVWTNEFHHLVWAEVRTKQVLGLTLMDNAYGPWFWVHIAYTYITFLAGTVLFFRFAVTSTSIYKNQSIAFLVAALFPWVSNIIFSFRIFPYAVLDTTAITFAISGIALWWAIFRYNLLDIMPIAKDAALENMRAGIIICDNQERIVEINHYMERLLNCRAAEVTGQLLNTLLGRFTQISSSNGLENVYTGELCFEGNDKTTFYEAKKLVLRDRKGRKTGSLMILFDTTENVETQQALEETENLLFQSQKMEALGRLASGIAHDFNNILTTILGYTDILHNDKNSDLSFYECTGEIKKAAKRGAELTNQLLTFSRKRFVKHEQVSINAVLAEIENMLFRFFGEKVFLTIKRDDDSGILFINKNQVEQIIMNLTINAVDAMPRGGKLTIQTSRTYLSPEFCRRHDKLTPGPYSLLEVSDTGEGMDKNTIENIFEPFFTTKPVGKGTGLGLSTVYGIVKQNNGHIDVHSVKNRGTTFRVYLPIVQDELSNTADTN